MKKYILGALIISIALLFCFNLDVQAATTNEGFETGDWIADVFIKKERPNNAGTEFKQGRFLRRTSDHKFVYCLQPFVEIDHNVVYNFTMQDYSQIANMTEEQWQKVVLIAYYGYQYGNHTADKWYYITQVMIWRVVAPNNAIYFTNTLAGERNDNLFASEIKEINDLVANHNKKPSFKLDSTKVNIGSTLTLEDSNKVLSNYTVTSSNNLSVSKSGNQLTIKANGIGAGKITFRKAANLYNTDPVLYYATSSQNILGVGNYDPITMSIDLEVIGGKVTVHKVDRETGENIPQGEGSLAEAVYVITDESGMEIAEIKTGLDGTVQSDYLPFIGKYKLFEKISSVGYEVDGTEYSFQVTEDNLFPDVTVYEQVIRRKIKIGKFFANADTGKLNPEKDIIFEFYDKNNNKVTSVKTDSDGYAELSLPYGTYTGKQITTTSGHEKIEDFTITINEDSPEEIKLAFTNALISARLKVIKIDAETQKIIQRSGITFKIYNVDKKEYVCQTISYPKAEILCEFKTSADGILYTPYELSAGTYRLEEVNQVIDGYLWNKQSKKFTIDENSEFTKDSELGVIFEVKFENKQVKGKIIINKIGEKFIIDNGFKYEEIQLKDVEFEIRANEDITIGGKDYYKKGDLVAIIKTSDDGTATLDNLPLGKYLLLEKTTDSNHILLEEPIEFELEYKDQYTEKVVKEFNLKNYYNKGTLEFTKTDLVDSEPIPNVEICIYTEDDDLVYCGETDSAGQIIITEIPVGIKLFLIERRAADGYQITQEKIFFEILENGEIVEANLKNEKVKIDVPDTDLNATYYFEIIGGVLFILGVGGLVYASKKKSK